jgi:hypothetical protein
MAVFIGKTLVEAVRFELTEGANPRQFSRLLHSTALPRFQGRKFNLSFAAISPQR